MSLPTPTDIRQNFLFLFEVAKFRPGSTAAFQTDNVSLSKSFWLAPFLFPFFFISILGSVLAADSLVSTTFVAWSSLLVYSIAWTFFPVVLHQLGAKDDIRRYTVARNWLAAVSFLATAVFGFLAGLFLLAMEWFLIKDALRQSNGRAFMLFLLTHLLMGSLVMYYLSSVGVDQIAVFEAAFHKASEGKN